MPQITNKIKLSGLFTIALFASWMLVSCGEKKAGEADTTVADSTVVQPRLLPDSLMGDSLPPIDDSASTRPEPRKTK